MKIQEKLSKLGLQVLSPLKDQKNKNKIYAYHCVVPFDKIQYAPYQRGLSKPQVTKIKDNFDIRAAQPFVLSYRPSETGSLWGVDCRHRNEAMAELGYTKHSAYVNIGLEYHDEAALFFNLNAIPKRMAGWVNFKAAFNAGNDVYRRLLEISTGRGLTDPVSTNLKVSDCDIKSQTMLLHPFKSGSYDLVKDVCRVLDVCWRSGGRGEPVQEAAKHVDLIRGLTSFLKVYRRGPDKDRLRWRTIDMVLRAHTAEYITELSRRQVAKGRPDQKQFYDAFCEIFSKQKKGGGLPKPPKVGLADAAYT